MLQFEIHELAIDFAKFRIFRRLTKPGVVANGVLLGCQRDFQRHLTRRAADFQTPDGEYLAIFQAGNFDEIADIFFRHRARAGAVAVKITLLQRGAVLALLIRHVPESGSNLQRFGIAEFSEHLGEPVIDSRVPLFNEDGDVERLLGSQRSEVAFHSSPKSKTTAYRLRCCYG